MGEPKASGARRVQRGCERAHADPDWPGSVPLNINFCHPLAIQFSHTRVSAQLEGYHPRLLRHVIARDLNQICLSQLPLARSALNQID